MASAREGWSITENLSGHYPTYCSNNTKDDDSINININIRRPARARKGMGFDPGFDQRSSSTVRCHRLFIRVRSNGHFVNQVTPPAPAARTITGEAAR